MRTLLPLAVSGAVLIGASGIAWLTSGQMSKPGQLVARQATVTAGGPASSADGTFTLVNVGGLPVKILSVTSGCGCATPTVEPSLIAPGRTGTVTVSTAGATLSVGERTVPITLRTDSPVAPEVSLKFRTLGSARPPFVAHATGDLAFGRDIRVGEHRPVVVEVVERGRPERKPTLASDLPFLRIHEEGMTEKANAYDPSVFHRYNSFNVEVAERPPDSGFQGRVTVNDPWNTDRDLAIHVQGEPDPAVRIAPSRGILRISGPTDRAAKLAFLVSLKEPCPDLRIEAEGGAESPLVVERVEAADAKTRSVSFDIRLRPGNAAVDGVHNIVIRPTESPADAVIVPVLLRKERPS